MDDLLTLIIESENTTERKIKLIKDVFNISKDKQQSSWISLWKINPFVSPNNPPFGKHEIMYNWDGREIQPV